MAAVQKEIDKWQPDWVALRILDFARKVHEFGNDDKALAEWTRKMSEDLIFNNTSSEDEFTQNLLAEASEAYAKKSKAGRKGGIAKARKQKQKAQEVAGNGNAPDESGNGLEEYHDQEPDKASNPRGDNTANNASGIGPEPDSHLNGDALSGDASDGDLTRESVDPDRTTVSEETNGHKGTGASPVREPDCHNAPVPNRRVKPPKNSAEVMSWAADHDIDPVDARDWYELNYVIRPGCDKDGCIISNWPGHCIAYCRSVKEKRESA